MLVGGWEMGMGLHRGGLCCASDCDPRARLSFVQWQTAYASLSLLPFPLNFPLGTFVGYCYDRNKMALLLDFESGPTWLIGFVRR